jgi:hypothetical protein
MAKKRKKLTPEQLAEWKRRSERSERVLRERIAYHEARMEPSSER